MAFYIKFGDKYFKKTRNRRIYTTDAILGTKASAKVYGTEGHAKKSITTREYQYPEMKGKLIIVPVNSEEDVDITN